MGLGSPAARRDARWWRADDEEECAKAVVRTAERLIAASTTRHQLDLRHLRLYGNAKYSGLGPTQLPLDLSSDRLALNVIASCVETAAAKIAKNKPAPQFVTNGADWTLRRRAKKLNKFGKGCLHQSRTYEMGPRVFRDAGTFGTGVVKVLMRDWRLCAERVFPWELLVDDVESVHGEPRQMMQRKFIDREVLKERFPKYADAIDRAKRSEKQAPGRDTLADQIEVYEAWHLRSGPKAKDGRHVIAISTCLLLDEAWDRERFPFAIYRWEEPIAGFWGKGIAERLTGIQFEINRLLRKIQESMHRLGVTRIIMEAGSGIPESHVNNEIGAILVKNPGTQPPVVVAAQSVHPEIFAQLDRLYQRAFEEIGLSQLSAQSKKPAGLDAAVAIREYNDIETERFALAAQRWETWHLDVVRLCIDEVRAAGGKVRVDVPLRRGELERIDWTDVSLEDDAYVLQCFPVSMLPQRPEGRLERAQELIQSGLAPRDRILEMLDIPDFESIEAEQMATSDVVDWAIDRMLDDGEYVQPEPYYDLGLSMRRATSAYLIELRHGAPEDRLELLRRFIDDCDAMQQQAAQAAAPPPGAPPGAPGAEQMTPPVAPPMGAPPGTFPSAGGSA